jgi:hypothetical protein
MGFMEFSGRIAALARGRPSLSDDMVKFSFSLPRELRDRFMERMRADDLPASSLLRHAIEAYLATPRPVFFGAIGAASTDRPAPKPAPAPRRDAQVSSPEATPAPEPSVAPQAPRAVLGGELFDMIWAVNAEVQAELEAEAQEPANAEKHD